MIYPALTRLRDFLKNEYLRPRARRRRPHVHEGRRRALRYRCESTTTTDDDARADPPARPQRSRADHQGVREGPSGSRLQGRSPRTSSTTCEPSPKFQPKSREQLDAGFLRAIKKKVEAEGAAIFSLVPKTPLVIRPYPPFREKFEAGGSYDSGTPDGSRPGTFYFNAYDLPSRSTWEETTLFLHEGEPGHHFQISLAQENTSAAAFMRFGGNTAYVEGWALYAETLGYDMGLYKDPYQRFGTLNDEMLRAMRLVVDTGIHAKGWTRDQSIEYMLDHSGMSRRPTPPPRSSATSPFRARRRPTRSAR